jgi:type IV secretion system protein VirB8
MNNQAHSNLSGYFGEAQSWAEDRERQQRFSTRLAWGIAAIASLIAVAEAIAIAAMAPLKTTVPYTLLVDRQTGHVEALDPLKPATIAPDKALTRSLLAQYVMAREGFAIESLQHDYRKVALWSSGEARQAYVNYMQPSNPLSPLGVLPRGTLVQPAIRGITSIGPNTALIRFDKVRADPNGGRRTSEPWAAVVTYRFSGAEMSMADRLINPLGFQVVRYRSDAEMPVSTTDLTQSNFPAANLPTAQTLP